MPVETILRLKQRAALIQVRVTLETQHSDFLRLVILVISVLLHARLGLLEHHAIVNTFVLFFAHFVIFCLAVGISV